MKKIVDGAFSFTKAVVGLLVILVICGVVARLLSYPFLFGWRLLP